MHFEYALDSLNANLKSGRTKIDAIKFLCMDQILELAAKTGNEKIKGICDSIKKCSQSKYKKPTDKQLFCIANYLLEENMSLSRIIKEAFNITDEEILKYINEEKLETLLSNFN